MDPIVTLVGEYDLFYKTVVFVDETVVKATEDSHCPEVIKVKDNGRTEKVLGNLLTVVFKNEISGSQGVVGLY